LPSAPLLSFCVVSRENDVEVTGASVSGAIVGGEGVGFGVGAFVGCTNRKQSEKAVG
jgi:hypothetical protein